MTVLTSMIGDRYTLPAGIWNSVMAVSLPSLRGQSVALRR